MKRNKIIEQEIDILTMMICEDAIDHGFKIKTNRERKDVFRRAQKSLTQHIIKGVSERENTIEKGRYKIAKDLEIWQLAKRALGGPAEDAKTTWIKYLVESTIKSSYGLHPLLYFLSPTDPRIESGKESMPQREGKVIGGKREEKEEWPTGTVGKWEGILRRKKVLRSPGAKGKKKSKKRKC